MKRSIVLTLLLCLCLTACQAAPGEDPVSEERARLVPYTLSGEGARSLTLEGRWELTLEDSPSVHDYSQTTSLVCRDLETGAQETWTSLYYNPYGVEEDDILLYPFQDVMGCSGAALFSRAEHTERKKPTVRFFRHDGGVPDLIAECQGDLYTARVDGFDLLLSAYPFGYDGTRGGAALYWQEEDGRVFCRPLRDAVEHFLGLSWPASVSLSLQTLEETGTLAACWQGDESPEHTMELDLSALLAYARAQAARTEEVLVDCLDGEELKLVLEERRLETEYGWDCFEVEKISVYRGAVLLQTLLPQDWLDLADWGLYDHTNLSSSDSELGKPLLLYLNGDQTRDFGLICDTMPGRNLPYLYFLWDGEAERFVPLAVLCSPVEVDPETGQVVERINEGNGVTTTNRYEFDRDGGLTLLRSETTGWDGDGPG